MQAIWSFLAKIGSLTLPGLVRNFKPPGALCDSFQIRNIDFNKAILKMPDNKQKCKTCKQRHLRPTGKKCQFTKEKEINNELLRDAAVSSGVTESLMS